MTQFTFRLFVWKWSLTCVRHNSLFSFGKNKNKITPGLNFTRFIPATCCVITIWALTVWTSCVSSAGGSRRSFTASQTQKHFQRNAQKKTLCAGCVFLCFSVDFLFVLGFIESFILSEKISCCFKVQIFLFIIYFCKETNSLIPRGLGTQLWGAPTFQQGGATSPMLQNVVQRSAGSENQFHLLLLLLPAVIRKRQAVV